MDPFQTGHPFQAGHPLCESSLFTPEEHDTVLQQILDQTLVKRMERVAEKIAKRRG